MNFGDPRLPARFWNKVNIDGDCWLWTGAINASGYGSTARGNGTCLAHRFAYEGLVGPLPPVLDHICHVRNCVNPGHLRPATPKENCENLTGAYRNSTTGIRGVRRSRDRWTARVRHNGVLHEVFGLATAEEAGQVARDLRNRLFTHNDADRVDAS